MAEINELELFARFVGTKISPENSAFFGMEHACLEKGYHDCTELAVSPAQLHLSTQLTVQFGLDIPLRLYWMRNAIEFTLFVYIKDGRVVGGRIRKTKRIQPQLGSGDGAGEAFLTDPNARELALVLEILKFLTLDY